MMKRRQRAKPRPEAEAALMPCPFCGCAKASLMVMPHGCYAYCPACHCEGGLRGDPDEAARMWNMRAGEGGGQ